MTSTTTIILMVYLIRGSLGHVLPASPMVRIAGGHPVNIEAAPFMAALVQVDKNETFLLCGGSIVHKQFVLTSASCIHSWISRVLYQVSVTVSPPADCDEYYYTHAYGSSLTARQICANTNGIGFCVNDEGGLLVAGPLQIGIASYGSACSERPTVYEKVAPHLHWIPNKIQQKL